MAQVLYRKYRSKSLADIVGQDHITKTLLAALKKGAISHAYLLTGPRGVGKTSIARILAHEVNQTPYTDDNNIDIIEIDAASNRRIDEIRDLRETIKHVPTNLKYKVYIIDEVHMLTREAFNALLKTLEEPPAHVIFILATTELHKLPETIVSRCQRFAFRHISEKDMLAHLKSIAKKEKISIDDESLHIIAQNSRGSLRDALSLLDQLASLADKVTEKDTRAVIGYVNSDIIKELLELMRNGDMVSLLSTYRSAIESGSDPVTLSDQIANELRASFHKSTDPKLELELLKNLLTIGSSRNPEAALEVAILLSSSTRSTTVAPAPVPLVEPALKATATSKTKRESSSKKQTTRTVKKEEEPKEETTEPEPAETTQPTKRMMTLEDWPDLLAQIKKTKNTLYGIMRMAKAEIEGGDINLHFAFPFHVKRADDTTSREVFLASANKLGLSFASLDIHHNPDLKNDIQASNEPETGSSSNSTVPENVMNVFSGAEVMES